MATEPYVKQTWDTTSYVNPTRMNHIEDGIANAMTSGNMGYLGAKNLNKFPYYNTSSEINGVTWTVYDDGTVKANGTASGSSSFILHSRSQNEAYSLILPNGQYILSGCATGGSSSKYVIGASRTYNGANQGLGIDTGNGVVITLDGDDYSSDEVDLQLYISVASGQSVSNLIFKPMLRLIGDNDTEFQPYSMTNQELTDVVYDKHIANVLGAKNLLPVEERTLSAGQVDYVGSNGVCSVEGTASGNAWFGIQGDLNSRFPYSLKKGQYVLSTDIPMPEGARISIYQGSTALFTMESGTSELRFTLNSDTSNLFVGLRIASGTEVDFSIKPMIRYAEDTDKEYQPYAMSNQEITKVIGNTPTTAGTYTLQLVVDSSGNKTFSWV